MTKYAKVIDDTSKRCEVGLGTNAEFYRRIGMTVQEVEQAYDGNWYLAGYAPVKPEPTILEQIEALENSITARNIREAILDPEGWAATRIASINAQIEELRKQLNGPAEESDGSDDSEEEEM